VAPNIKNVAVALAKATDPKVTSVVVELLSGVVNDTTPPSRSARNTGAWSRPTRAIHCHVS